MTYGAMVHFSKYKFEPVIDLPADYEVFDFSKNYDPHRKLNSSYGVGRYNEKRPTMYDHKMFGGVRNIHMGVDIAAPIGTPVKSFYAGEIFLFGNNSQPGDYGYTLLTRHVLDGTELFALYGHLSAKSMAQKTVGQSVKAGEVIAWVGDKTENGGWNSHLHFQLSFERPEKPDLPGVVTEAEREAALAKYPDPRLVLGPLY